MRTKVGLLAARYGAVVALLVVLFFCHQFYSGFFQVGNVNDLVSENVPDGLVALGMTFVIIAGGFDLSVGGSLSLCAVLYADAANHMALGYAAGIALGIGLLAGCINGVVISWFKVNPFVATLGSGSIYLGLAYIFANSGPIAVNKTSFQNLGNDSWFGVPISVYVLCFAAVGAAVILAKTRYGRSIYAIGGNAEASRLCGIPVDTVRASTYALTGLTAAAGGMIVASRLTIVEASVGANTPLNTIAIVVVGGTSLLGGEGAIWRTAVGFLILESLTDVFNAKAVNANWQDIVTGLVIIGAVVIDVVARRFIGKTVAA